MSADITAAKEFFLKGIAAIDANMFSEAETFFLKTLELAPEHVAALTNLALSQYQQAKIEAAIETAQQIIAADPENLDALFMLASCKNVRADTNGALQTYEKIISLDPQNAEAHANRGYLLIALSRFDDALAAFDKTIALNSGLPNVWLNRGHCLMNLKRYADAIASYDTTIALNENALNAWLGRGGACIELKRHDDALASYDRALLLKPDFEAALFGRADVLVELKRYDDAWSVYRKAAEANPESKVAWLGCGNASALGKNHERAIAEYDKALTLDSTLESAWLGRGNVFTELRRYDEGAAAYARALALNPALENAMLGRGNILVALERYDEALAIFREALKHNPHLAKAWIGIGNALYGLKRFDDALTAFDKAIAINADLENAWTGRGNALTEAGRHQEAFVSYDKAFSINPDLSTIEGARLHAKMQLCDWVDFDAERARLKSRAHSGTENTTPFAFIGLSDSPEAQLQYARLWTAKQHPASTKPIWQGETHKHGKIRVAYLSPDFRHHAVSYLMAGVFEARNKDLFETTGVSFGHDDKSNMRGRIEKSFDTFIDVRDKTDAEVAHLLRSREIDIAVDLAGFTLNARTNILAQRPCPIQINYLGYPGTLGAGYIDYLIADPTLIPASTEKFYAEKIAFLPDSYLPSDTIHRAISTRQFSRLEFGLPETGFVFCCFNNAYKLTPEVFSAWMDILTKVESSVLWLSELNATASHNLREQAAAANVNPNRLIFAKRIQSSADHLARHRLADIFLDTWPYNAHTTASDALWAGLPVLTKIGETFAGRVAASLLTVVGLKELIVTSADAYKNKAIHLATHPLELQAIKNKLRHDRASTPLFDTQLFTRNLERLYQAMYARYRNGLAPERIVLGDRAL